MFSTAVLFSIKSECMTFLSPKKHELRVQKSNTGIFLLHVFKHEAVQLLVAKNLAVKHLPLNAFHIKEKMYSNLYRFCVIEKPLKPRPLLVIIISAVDVTFFIHIFLFNL